MARSAMSAITPFNDNIDLPYVVVTETSTSGFPYDKMTATQRREATISFIVCVDNTKQKGSMTGAKSIQVMNSLIPCIEQVENALLGWKPVNIDLADTPLFIDRGMLEANNTKLWYEVVWTIPYIVYNPLFRGLGSQAVDDDEDDVTPLTEVGVMYGEEPVKLFLDEWIYGPQTNPPPRPIEDIDADLAAGGIVYVKVGNDYVMETDRQIITGHYQTRGQVVVIIDDAITYHHYSGTGYDTGFLFLYSPDGLPVYTYNGERIQALDDYRDRPGYVYRDRHWHRPTLLNSDPGFALLYTSAGVLVYTYNGEQVQALDDYITTS
ncbi:MAG: hypothetical protein ABW007_19300 [Chitinophagaceae bacterium]